MRLELVSIETSTYPLDGAFYQPESGAGKGAILIMHGNCGNFYTGVPRHFAPLLVRLLHRRAAPFCAAPGAATCLAFLHMYARARVMGFYIILRARRLNW